MARRYTSKVSRTVSWGLGALMSAAVLGVGLATYVAVAHTTIVVTVKPVPQSAEFSLTVQPVGTTLGSDDGVGSLVETSVTGTATQPSAGQQRAVIGKAHGTVTITNTWSQAQPLAATTRLLSSDGILFRTTARVDVPARGSAVADVVADLDGSQGDIGPSTFSIPGLSADMQQRVTGKSDAAMSGGITQAGVLSVVDLTAVQAAAGANAEAQLNQWSPSLPAGLSLIDGLRATTVTSEKLSAKAGEQASDVTATTTLKVRALALDAQALKQRAERELTAALTPGTTLTGDPLTYHLVDQQIRLDNGVLQNATLRILVDGRAQPAANNPTFATTNLTARTADEITSVLQTADFVKSVQIHFAPFWSHRSSRLPDHIIVTVKQYIAS